MVLERFHQIFNINNYENKEVTFAGRFTSVVEQQNQGIELISHFPKVTGFFLLFLECKLNSCLHFHFTSALALKESLKYKLTSDKPPELVEEDNDEDVESPLQSKTKKRKPPKSLVKKSEVVKKTTASKPTPPRSKRSTSTSQQEVARKRQKVTSTTLQSRKRKLVMPDSSSTSRSTTVHLYTYNICIKYLSHNNHC